MICLIVTGVSLFFAMYFGNAFSIPGVIVLLLICIMVIVALSNMLGESQQEAVKQRTARKMVENENQKLKAWIDQQQHEQELKKKIEEQSCLVM